MFQLTNVGSGETEEVTSADELFVYPNPVIDNELLIQTMLDSDSKIYLSIFNTKGQLIFTENPGNHKSGMFSYVLNISDVENGMYILQLESNEMNKKVSFIRQ